MSLAIFFSFYGKVSGADLTYTSQICPCLELSISRQPLFFEENQERLRREVIGNVSISIHELLAVARESEGVKAVQGDDMLCEKRFAPDTRYMVEFLLLEQKEQFGEKGEYHRYFLTKEAYQELINLQNKGVLRFQRQALVLEGTLHYLPAQAFFRDRE